MEVFIFYETFRSSLWYEHDVSRCLTFHMLTPSGSHCNVSQFFIPKGVTAFIKKYDGTSGGIFEVYSEVSTM